MFERAAERPDAVPFNAELTERLAAIRARQPDAQPELVAEVVRAVLNTMSGDLGAKEMSLLAEVEALGQTIAMAKQEIAALKVDDITAAHIPFATDELDAIVHHTASATHNILTSCETLDEVAGSVSGETAAKLQDATTRIYEACSFQDITGQRITKVVSALKTIEAKVAQIVFAFGEHAGEPGAAPESPPGDVELLNGPQLPHHAMDQSDIDKLLASFE